MSKLFSKSEDGSITLRVVIPERFQVAGVNWSQRVIEMRDGPVSPAPLVLTDSSYEGQVAAVTVTGGQAGARYEVTSAPGPWRGEERPGWVKVFRVQVV